MFSVLPESLEIQKMKTFVGKNTQLKQAAVCHAIIQAVRQRAVIGPLPFNMSWCATVLRIWVQISNRDIAQPWFLFILSTSSEVSAKLCCFTAS